MTLAGEAARCVDAALLDTRERALTGWFYVRGC